MADHGSGAWYARAVAQLAHACLGEGDLERARTAVEAARSLTGQCRKLEALAQQVQSNAPLPGGVKKAHKKARLQT